MKIVLEYLTLKYIQMNSGITTLDLTYFIFVVPLQEKLWNIYKISY